MKQVKLGEIATIYNGNSINQSVKKQKYMNDVPGWNYIATKDVGVDGKITYQNGVIIPYSEKGFRIAPAGSVFVCSEGGSAGKKTAVLQEDVCFGNKLFAIVNDKGLYNEKYLFYYTRFERFREQFKLLATSLMGGISVKNFSAIKVPLCILQDQHRIVSCIEELFSQLDSGVETLKKTKEQLKVYRQAVLKEAFESASSSNSKNLTIIDLLTKKKKGMTTGPFGTMLKKHEHQSSGVPVLGIENIGKVGFVDGNKIFVSEEKAKELSAFKVDTDDLIISRSGTVGEICIVPPHMKNALLSTNLMRISLDFDVIRADYFMYLFKSKGVVIDQVKELCKGSTRMFLNQTILKQIIFPVPTLKIQAKIIETIESRLSVCDSIEKTIDTALQEAEALRQSILKQAFEGGL